MLDPRLYLFAAEYFLCAICFLAVVNVWMDHFEAQRSSEEKPITRKNE